MSCEEYGIFFVSFAYIAHIRQNHSNFPPIETKINLKKVILNEVPIGLNFFSSEAGDWFFLV
jgi:hypothetical protein